MRPRISISGSVRPSVRPSVRRSVRPSVGPLVRNAFFLIQQNRLCFAPTCFPSHLLASSHLYKRVFPSVRPSDRPSVRHAFFFTKIRLLIIEKSNALQVKELVVWKGAYGGGRIYGLVTLDCFLSKLELEWSTIKFHLFSKNFVYSSISKISLWSF